MTVVHRVLDGRAQNTAQRGERKIIDLNSIEVQLLLRIISVSSFPLRSFNSLTHICISLLHSFIILSHSFSFSLVFAFLFFFFLFFLFIKFVLSLIAIMYLSEIDFVLHFFVFSLSRYNRITIKK